MIDRGHVRRLVTGLSSLVLLMVCACAQRAVVPVDPVDAVLDAFSSRPLSGEEIEARMVCAKKWMATRILKPDDGPVLTLPPV